MMIKSTLWASLIVCARFDWATGPYCRVSEWNTFENFVGIPWDLCGKTMNGKSRVVKVTLTKDGRFTRQ